MIFPFNGDVLRIVSVLMSCVFLAWVAGAILGPAVGGGRSEEASFTIETLPIEGRRADEGAYQIHLRYLYADGQPYGLWDVQREGAWEDHYGGLRYGFPAVQDPSLSGRLTLSAHRLVLGLEFRKEGGAVRVVRDGELGPANVIDLRTESEGAETLFFDFPRRESAGWLRPLVFLTGLALAAALFARWGAGMDRVWLIVHLTFLHTLVWLGTLVGVTEDSDKYFSSVPSMLEGTLNYFPPGYGLLVGMSSVLPFEGEGIRVTLLHAGLAVVTGVWLHRILQRFCPPATALIAALLACSAPTMLWMARSPLSETLTMFCLIGGVHWSLCARESGLRRHAVLAGLLAGWGGLTRILPLLVLLPVFLAHSWPLTRRSLSRAGVSIGVALFCVLLPMSWVKINSGRFALADSSQGHLFNAVVYQHHLLDPQGPFTRAYLNILEGEDPFGREHHVVREWLQTKGLDYQESSHALGQIAMEAIKKQPWVYVSSSVVQAWGQLFMAPGILTDAVVPVPVPGYDTPPPLGCSAEMLHWRELFTRLGVACWAVASWLFLLSGLACLVLRDRRGLLVLFWIVPAYLGPQAFVENSEPRYTAPMTPFVIALSVVIVGEALRRAFGRFKADSS